MKIYVASSWRNLLQPGIVSMLRQLGHEVYDFRNPPGRSGFAWSEIDPDCSGTPTRTALRSSITSTNELFEAFGEPK